MPPAPPTGPPPLGWWSVVWRYLVAVWVGAILWMLTLLTGMDAAGEELTVPPGLWAPMLLDLALGAVALVLMWFRRRWPLPIAVAVSALTAASAYSVGAWTVVLISLCTRRRAREIGLASAVSFGAAVAYERFVAPVPIEPWQLAPVVNALSIGLVVVVGLYVGARRELVAQLRSRAETAEREQAMRMAQARVTERSRIAREMHDVIAHRMSLVAMHAGALAYRADLSTAQVRETAGVVRDAAHEALTELRQVLGVLRDPHSRGPDSHGSAPEPPQPTLSDLPELMAEAEAAGTAVRVSGSLPPAPMPAALGRTVYRMVQEALTNARKHAPGAPVHVRIDGEPGRRVELEVGNPVAPGAAPSGTPGAGLGLTGLAERAVLAGGTFEHTQADGWFAVRASLPWQA